MLNKNKYREMFVQETHEHIQHLNKSLLSLEKEPERREYLDDLFRSAHTVKGMAGTMGYDKIMHLCKAIEDVLDKLRKKETNLTSNLVNSLFKCFDLLGEITDDEKKVVDLEPYLKELQNPPKPKSDSESQIPFQLPTIRVNMEDLDSLVELVGELLIAKMRLEMTIPHDTSSETRQSLLNLGRLISDLQDQAIRLRLLPIEQVFNLFPRMVRDLSKSQGKEVNLEMDGLGIELDRTVLEAITDPLLHILRNAVDHGIETPAERIKVGKPKSGTIKLTASRVGDRVSIEVDDDGRGIDIQAIRSAAVEHKIISQTEVRLMTDEEVLYLLGTPGLTSADDVTDVSGRGVGFNVVRKQIETVGGYVKIETKKGQGTHITLTMPLSLAIIGGLVVVVGENRYVLPLASVTTTLNVDSSEIKSVHGKEVIMLRDQVIPLISVADVLGIKTVNKLDRTGQKVTLVVVAKGNKLYGLIVDSFERKQDIVIKHLNNSGVFNSKFSNATILSDGRVSLVLDPSILV